MKEMEVGISSEQEVLRLKKEMDTTLAKPRRTANK
jgi:hypothetical protein